MLLREQLRGSGAGDTKLSHGTGALQDCEQRSIERDGYRMFTAACVQDMFRRIAPRIRVKSACRESSPGHSWAALRRPVVTAGSRRCVRACLSVSACFETYEATPSSAR